VTTTQDIARRAEELASTGAAAALGRVVDIQGFSTWPGNELVIVEGDGTQIGEVLGRLGAEALRQAAHELLAGPARFLTITVAVHGIQVAELGLACGGQAEILMQPLGSVPRQLWSIMAGRSPVALLTRLGPSGAHLPLRCAVVEHGSRVWGEVGGDPAFLVNEAVRLLAGGHSTSRRLDDDEGSVLLESWVATPRLVVVGTGELVEAIDAQAALLGWEARAAPNVAEVPEALEWAGGSAALVVLAHDPHVDTPALLEGLRHPTTYLGAMGSRATQSKRLERLAAAGATPEELERIHRPIGLDLGGRGAPEMALSICAEILAVRCGRDGRSLSSRSGSIHEEPRVVGC